MTTSLQINRVTGIDWALERFTRPDGTGHFSVLTLNINVEHIGSISINLFADKTETLLPPTIAPRIVAFDSGPETP